MQLDEDLRVMMLKDQLELYYKDILLLFCPTTPCL